MTDPSGKTLLSSGDIGQRKVVVSAGVLVHSSDIEHYVPQIDGVPAVPYTQCYGITVQLAPFNDTPNPGGEYKVWVTKITDYNSELNSGSFGFIASKSKTDNFKVVNSALPDPSLDSDTDGIPDVDEIQNGSDPFNPFDPCCLMPG